MHTSYSRLCLTSIHVADISFNNHPVRNNTEILAFQAAVVVVVAQPLMRRNVLDATFAVRSRPSTGTCESGTHLPNSWAGPPHIRPTARFRGRPTTIKLQGGTLAS